MSVTRVDTHVFRATDGRLFNKERDALAHDAFILLKRSMDEHTAGNLVYDASTDDLMEIAEALRALAYAQRHIIMKQP